MKKLHNESVVPLHRNRRLVHMTNLMFKRKKSGKFRELSPSRTRARDAATFTIVQATNKIFERRIFFKGAREWNS